MNIRPVGGVWWRIGSDGNLTAFDPTGAVVAKFIGGVFSGSSNKATQNDNATITSTSSLTGVATGFGQTITPVVSATVVWFWVIDGVSSDTAGDGALFGNDVVVGGTSLAGGTADTTSSFPGRMRSSAIGELDTITLVAYSLTLIPGTQYTNRLTARALTGGIASWASVNRFAFEV